MPLCSSGVLSASVTLQIPACKGANHKALAVLLAQRRKLATWEAEEVENCDWL